MRSHIIQRDDTLLSIAKRYTGDPKRWPELVQVNPKLRTAISGTVGSFKAAWKQNTTLALPAGWVASPVVLPVAAPKGTVGEGAGGCDPGSRVISDVKDYLYVVQSGDANEFAKVPTRFGMPVSKLTGTTTYWYWKELRDANPNWFRGYSQIATNAGCVPIVEAGDTMNVPATWMEPKVAGITVPRSKSTTPDKNDTGGDTTTGGGGNTSGGGGEGSSYTWLWVVLGVGAAVGLGMIATGALKTKKGSSPAPATSA